MSMKSYWKDRDDIKRWKKDVMEMFYNYDIEDALRRTVSYVELAHKILYQIWKDWKSDDLEIDPYEMMLLQNRMHAAVVQTRMFAKMHGYELKPEYEDQQDLIESFEKRGDWSGFRK